MIQWSNITLYILLLNAIIALVQIVNYFNNLKSGKIVAEIKVEIAEQENRILAKIDDRYVPKPIFEAKIDEMNIRFDYLEKVR